MSIGDQIIALQALRAISSQDSMYNQRSSADIAQRHYFAVGLSGIGAIFSACQVAHSIGNLDEKILDILDFGCGHGRIARFIRAAFPNATVWCTDRDLNGVEYCVNALGCAAVADPLPAGSMDLIWLGSVFTHLPSSAARSLLGYLVPALKPSGIIVFTTQGRYSYERLRQYDWERASEHPWENYNLPREKIEVICEGFETAGYGYSDYREDGGYGVSIVRPEWYARQCADIGLRQVYFNERGFDNHQDVLGFMNRQILDADLTPWMRLAERFLNSSGGEDDDPSTSAPRSARQRRRSPSAGC